MDQTDFDGRILRNSPGLSAVSVTLGAIALLTCFILPVSLPLGALAVIFGLLSRGNTIASPRARLGIMFGAGAMVATTAVTGYAAYSILTNPAMMSQFDEMMDYYADLYGLDEESLTPAYTDPSSDDQYRPDQLLPDQDPQEAPAADVEGGSFI